MDRHELGVELLNWHGGQSDPLYAVGSFYIDGKVYPDKSVVESALGSIESKLAESRRMLAGEAVMVSRQGRQVSLREFAGYSDDDLNTMATAMEAMIAGLRSCIDDDYNADDAPDTVPESRPPTFDVFWHDPANPATSKIEPDGIGTWEKGWYYRLDGDDTDFAHGPFESQDAATISLQAARQARGADS